MAAIPFQTSPPSRPAAHRFTVAEYEAILEVPAFVKLVGDHHFELVNGQIIEQPPVNDPHWLATQHLVGRFAALGSRMLVNHPVVISGFDEPEPDLAVLRVDFPFSRKAGGADLLLAIEISDKSRLEYDRDTKGPRYLDGHVPEVWILNLVEQCLLRYVHSDPAARHDYGRGAQVHAVAVPEVTIDVDAIFRAVAAARPVDEH
jgi:Uma2 family endonuclease